MLCKVEGCGREAMYKKDELCQKHYFRFMRHGTFELTNTRKYRLTNPAGYKKIYEPKHFLSNKDGYVYEHRFIYAQSGQQMRSCEMCGKEINWKTSHIDHIDNDVANNQLENLRAVCRGCNVFRAHTVLSQGKIFITLENITLTPTAWARQPDVTVSSTTIRRRFLSGASAYDAIYGDKTTHRDSIAKKTELRYDTLRGIEKTYKPIKEAA